ncbi:MAG: SMC family ATPase [Oscillatoriales cyanobacterium SM2_2_1]|nr:SMC family ATPase [Oscillatoriales cyanobacterium SM2_2_1]
MRLISLRLENFRQHRATEIAFPAGLVGILGENGAGKTTILEAIAWALYGNQGGVIRGTTESLIWRRAPGRSAAVAELTFAYGGQTYRVRRSQSASKGNAEVFQEQKVIANSTKATNEFLTRLLGMTHQEFFNSYFTGQKELQFLGNLAGSTDRERFIARMLGYDRLTEQQGESGKPQTIRGDRQAQKILISRLQGGLEELSQVHTELAITTEQLTTLQTQVTAAITALQTHQQERDRLTPTLNTLEQTRDRHRELEQQLQLLDNQIHNQHQRLKELTSETHSLSAANQRLQSLQAQLHPYADLVVEQQHLTQLQQQVQHHQSLQKQIDQLSTQITERDRQLQDHADLPQSQAALTAAIAQLEQQLHDTSQTLKTQEHQWQQERTQLATQIQSAQQYRQKLHSQHHTIHSAGQDGNCPTCDRPLHQEFHTVLDQFQEQIDQLDQQISCWQQQYLTLAAPPTLVSALERQLEILQQQHKEQFGHQRTLDVTAARLQQWQQDRDRLNHQRDHLQQQQQTLPSHYDHQRAQIVATQLLQLAPLHTEALQLSHAPQRLLQLQQQQHALTAELQTLGDRHHQNQQSLDHLAFDPATYQHTRDRHYHLSQTIEQSQHHLAQLQQEHSRLQERHRQLGDRQVLYQQRQQQLQAAQSQALLLDALDQCYTDLRQHLVSQIRPQLSETASHYLSQLTTGRYSHLELNETYKLTLYDSDTPKPILSGGEEDIANLSLRLAISHMLTERTTRPFSLLILDEIFGSLDQNRQENVINLLYALEQQFEQVLLITHIETIKESIPQVIRLAYNPISQSTEVVAE